jgi:hypothetical protein
MHRCIEHLNSILNKKNKVKQIFKVRKHEPEAAVIKGFWCLQQELKQ